MAWTALIMWYTCDKLAWSKILQNFWLTSEILQLKIRMIQKVIKKGFENCFKMKNDTDKNLMSQGEHFERSRLEFWWEHVCSQKKKRRGNKWKRVWWRRNKLIMMFVLCLCYKRSLALSEYSLSIRAKDLLCNDSSKNVN